MTRQMLVAETARAQRRQSAVPEPHWPDGPLHPRLARNGVHVWRACLDDAAGEVFACLSAEERRRAARFPREHRGRRWATARAALRELLARYLGAQPRELEFKVDEHGKPSLSMRDAPLSFNLSHAGALALVALTHAAAVGVDVQATGGRRIDELAIAQRALGAEQASRLARLHPALRRRAFLRAWARHEAALKCHGMGLWSAHDVCARSPAGELWTSVLDLGAEAVGAVALERAPSELRCWSWSASSPSS